MTNNDCGRCGKCCEAIWLGYSKEQLERYYGSDHPDVKYVVENWNEITFEEFNKLNPWWITQFKEPEIFQEKVLPRSHFYTCNSFNKETRLCNDREGRPQVCRIFPLEGNESMAKIINGRVRLVPDYALYSENCVFQKIKASKEEWEKEEILTKDLRIER